MGKRCIIKALIVFVFMMVLCILVQYDVSMEAHGESFEELGTQLEIMATQETEETDYVPDLTKAFDIILDGVTKEFIAGYAVDESFLMWLDAKYGDETIIRLAYHVVDQEMNPEVWYQETGNSIHVLWLRFCQDSGFQNYQLDNVYWQDTADENETVLSFTGDFNFAEDWYTTDYLKEQAHGINDCFSEDLLQIMQNTDIMIMNNEFVYMQEDKSEPLQGKAYTFRAEPMMVELLQYFGVEAVTLANNHVYDYGEVGLLDTMDCLNKAGIAYVGAGKDIDEASKILYYVANGRKIAIVSASQIEKTIQYTREATATQPGVLKTLHPERFINVIQKAAANSDYVIVLPHWGTEGNLYPDSSQRMLAERYARAGADVIIGNHPHRLQGVGYVEDVPVAYSLGNFWFSDGTLYTTVAQVLIEADGEIKLRMLPCEQKDMVTRMLTGQAEKDGFYHYLASISMRVGIDAEGNVYDKTSTIPRNVSLVYDSDTSSSDIVGVTDNEGNAIDIVGNRK